MSEYLPTNEIKAIYESVKQNCNKMIIQTEHILFRPLTYYNGFKIFYTTKKNNIKIEFKGEFTIKKE